MRISGLLKTTRTQFATATRNVSMACGPMKATQDLDRTEPKESRSIVESTLKSKCAGAGIHFILVLTTLFLELVASAGSHAQSLTTFRIANGTSGETPA